MEVPVGFLARLWSFISFLPFFFLLFLLGLLKGLIIGPIVTIIIAVGNSAVVIGLWPAHFIWTYYCVTKTKKLGWVLKIALLVSLPFPLILWPIIAIIGSLLGGIGYGFFAPLIATFEAIGENITLKIFHCFVDGCISTLKGSCTVVRDFTDFCFHSYFSYMDELSEEMDPDEKPMEVKLSKLPSCVLVSLLAIPVDVPFITALALWKSPFMLFRGWKRLLEDLIGREGPFLETVCVPFAGLAIILWPLAVAGSVVASFFSSFALALYSGVVVHQEDSFRMGLAYILAAVSIFDEYTNDLLDMREGSCFTRPQYRRNMSSSGGLESKNSIEQKIEKEGSRSLKLISHGSKTLKQTIQQYTPMQVWGWLFKSCEVNGRILLREGLIDVKDIEECIVKGDCKKQGIKLPAWSILQCLLISAKSDSPGLLISDEVELTKSNWPKDKVFEWFLGPLLVMKEQIKKLQLREDEEISLRTLVMGCKNERPEEWDNTGFPSTDTVRRAQLQAVIRRLQGIVGSLSRVPTFRRRFKNLVKVLYLEAIQIGLVADNDGGSSKAGNSNRRQSVKGDRRNKDEGKENEESSRDGDSIV
ncbi:putative membrane protein At3g27390 isoform X1 [Nicotiana tabacum]|uniref:Membrane protein At3g27390 isoform X1 n=1 Tax=Nicotiana tabacum TaxID=4097 RepID=A0A1S4BE08_TOBAC